MTRIYVGPAAVLNLASVGAVDLLEAFDGDVVIPEAVADAVTTEPHRTNLEAFLADTDAETVGAAGREEAAMRVLDAAERTPEVAVVDGVLAAVHPPETAADGGDPEEDDEESEAPSAGHEPAVGVVADDLRLRRVTEGLGATVTGSFGVVVRAAVEDKYLKRSHAKRVVRRMDDHGTRLTGGLREQVLGAV
jgi:predicted nucleic acid-binding protein